MAYKEIVTKAVIGKGKRVSTTEYSLIPEEIPDTVLGCWIINHAFGGTNHGPKVEINGSFDINVWYSYDNDTKTAVTNKRFNYNEKMTLALKENAVLTDTEIIVRALKQPTVTDVSIHGDEVKMNVEKEIGAEIVGDTKIKIQIMDDEDDYEIITDEPTPIPEITDEDIEEIEEKVTEDYIE